MQYIPPRPLTEIPDEVRKHVCWHLSREALGDDVRVFAFAKSDATRGDGWERVKRDIDDVAGAGTRKAHTAHYWVWYCFPHLSDYHPRPNPPPQPLTITQSSPPLEEGDESKITQGTVRGSAVSSDDRFPDHKKGTRG